KQKVEDQMSFDAGFMKDVLQLIQPYTQSHNPAWRAAAGVGCAVSAREEKATAMWLVS
ncbi:YopD family type III secretion system translocon subunit, partial [Listeria monocytogenes]|nr:YopD family type III secretion system translocon subunit [Listeria monocytogenes]